MSKYALLVLFLLIWGGSCWLATQFIAFEQQIQESADTIHEPLQRGEISEKRPTAYKLEVEEQHAPLSIAILGIDGPSHEKGRSDTVMVLTIHPENKDSLLLSIPRDTRTQLVGRNATDKINHAWSYGGADMTVSTLEQLLDIPIDYYAAIRMQGFIAVIDILDGIDIDVQRSFEHKGFTFKQGPMHMDGAMALAYIRTRKLAGGDFNRNERQQQVIRALLDKASGWSSLKNLELILGEVEQHVRTNMEIEDMHRLLMHYLPAVHYPQRIHMQGSDDYTGGIYYFKIDPAEIERVSGLLKEHLEINESQHTLSE